MIPGLRQKCQRREFPGIYTDDEIIEDEINFIPEGVETKKVSGEGGGGDGKRAFLDCHLI